GLAKVVEHVGKVFREAGGLVEEQPFVAGGLDYKNVLGRFGSGWSEGRPRIVLGAHYDTCGVQPGADDNASGVAAILELARCFQAAPPPIPIELCAYCLEEPPYFRTPDMGSAVHARSLKERGVDVKAMFSLEMLGYYSDRRGSQRYPSILM